MDREKKVTFKCGHGMKILCLLVISFNFKLFFITYFVFIFAIRISPDIKDAALCTGIKLSNDTETWQGVLKVYMTTKSASEKNSAQSALACSKDTLILYKYVN
jgi:hypothetical protein